MFNPEDHVAKASITEAKIFGGDIKLGPHGQRCICGGMWQVPGACDFGRGGSRVSVSRAVNIRSIRAVNALAPRLVAFPPPAKA